MFQYTSIFPCHFIIARNKISTILQSGQPSYTLNPSKLTKCKRWQTSSIDSKLPFESRDVGGYIGLMVAPSGTAIASQNLRRGKNTEGTSQRKKMQGMQTYSH